MTTQNELLKECVASRHFLLSQIADLAEENGDMYLAEAWRWIRDNEKWPSRRLVNDKYTRRGYHSKRKYRYGWTYYPRCPSISHCGLDKQQGPTVMPYEFITELQRTTTPQHDTQEGAIAYAARGIASLLKIEAENNGDK